MCAQRGRRPFLHLKNTVLLSKIPHRRLWTAKSVACKMNPEQDKEKSVKNRVADCENGDDVSLWWSAADSPVEIPSKLNLLKEAQFLPYDSSNSFDPTMSIRLLCIAMDVDFRPLPPDDPVPLPLTIAERVHVWGSHEFLPSRFVSTAVYSSDCEIFGRFFPLKPGSDLSLEKMLAYWMRKGAVPVLCMNAPWDEEHLDSGWQYCVVCKVEQERIEFVLPSCFAITVDVPAAWKYFEKSFVQYVCANGLLGDSRISFDSLRDLKDFGEDLNVVGQIAYALETNPELHDGIDNCRSYRRSIFQSSDPKDTDAEFLDSVFTGCSSIRCSHGSDVDSITLPSRMEGGILLFARSDQRTLCAMISAIHEPLCDPKF